MVLPEDGVLSERNPDVGEPEEGLVVAEVEVHRRNVLDLLAVLQDLGHVLENWNKAMKKCYELKEVGYVTL